jgi:anti-anti-sigma factor
MRAQQHAPPLVVARSEVESGQVALRLIGELDLNTVELLAQELAHARGHSHIIDLSELRFLDLTGLRMLQRAGLSGDEIGTQLVGATGIVRRIIELTRTLEAESVPALGQPPAREPTTPVAAAQYHTQPLARRRATRRLTPDNATHPGRH